MNILDRIGRILLAARLRRERQAMLDLLPLARRLSPAEEAVFLRSGELLIPERDERARRHQIADQIHNEMKRRDAAVDALPALLGRRAGSQA